MGRFVKTRIAIAAIGLGLAAGMWLTAPHVGDPARLDGVAGDAAAGRLVFAATGCGSCHMPPGAEGADRLLLSGGQAFASPVGTFLAPNITPDTETGIGGWTLLEFADFVQFGVLPDGRHAYPVMPYGAYQHLTVQEIADLKAYLDGLASVHKASLPHDLGFPFSIRRAIGGWKWLFLPADPVVAQVTGPVQERGRHLVEAMAHCGECHTPRNAFGGLDRARWLAGAPTPDGKGRVPNITPAALDWSEAEIVTYLTQGSTPDFDFVGGHMAHVVDNLAELPLSDVSAIAAYLKRVAPIAEEKTE